MRESTWTAAVNKLVDKEVYVLKVSLRFTAGVPDCFYEGASDECWAEYKYLSSVPRELDLTGGKDPIITRLQQTWLTRRHNNGKRVMVVVGSPDGGVLFPALDWQRIITREEFLERALTKKEIAAEISRICLRNYK